MQIIKIVVSSVLVAAALFGNADANVLRKTAASTVPPPSNEITIDVVTVNGSGCPPGSATVAVSPDNTAFTVTYSKYLAKAGAGSDLTLARANCQLNLRVNVPGGFTYAIAQADYRGYALLQNGVTATQRANYYFQGSSPTAFQVHPFQGPWDDYWQSTDNTDIVALVFAPCGAKRNLNINTELKVNLNKSNPKLLSYIQMDSTDAAITTVYRFVWQKC